MPTAVDAPLAAPTGVKIVMPDRPPKPLPSPAGEIKLSAPAADKGPAATPAKPGSAKERTFSALRAKAGVEEPPAPSPGPAAVPAARAPEPAKGTEPRAPTTPAEPPAPAPAAEKTKVNPWKIVNEWKGKAAELEKALVEAKAASLPEQEKKGYLSRIQELTKRNTELEDEMRFVNYSKSGEFKEKYDDPYQKAVARAMRDIAGLKITDPDTNNSRDVTENDIFTLAGLGPIERRQLATQLYGDFANDMLGYVKEIRNLWETRAEALEEARTKGAAREKERFELFEKSSKERKDFITKTWNAVNDAAIHHETYGKFFTPIEGDQDGNQRLAKGFELVDRAFAENPNDPALSPEQRAAIIKRHAVVRNRAAATGRLIAWLNERDARIAALEKELGEIKGTTPPTGGRPAAPGTLEPATAHDRVFGALRKFAK